MPRTFTVTQLLPYPLETVFAFFADPANLPRLMPDWQDARIETATYVHPPPPPTPFPGSNRIVPRITAGTGTRLRLTIRPFPLSPVRLPWDALIEDFRWLSGFCDVQERGPFAYWRHCHTVTAEGPAEGPSTRLVDTVTYELPFGPLGRLADALFIQRQIAATFDFRHRRTLALLGAPGRD